MENLKWLNLEIGNQYKIIKNNGMTHRCYFLDKYNHELHSDHKQLNTIIDLQITIAELVANNKLQTEILEHVAHIRKLLMESKENIEYIKNQNNDILKIDRIINENTMDIQLAKQTEIIRELFNFVKKLKDTMGYNDE